MFNFRPNSFLNNLPKGGEVYLSALAHNIPILFACVFELCMQIKRRVQVYVLPWLQGEN